MKIESSGMEDSVSAGRGPAPCGGVVLSLQFEPIEEMLRPGDAATRAQLVDEPSCGIHDRYRSASTWRYEHPLAAGLHAMPGSASRASGELGLVRRCAHSPAVVRPAVRALLEHLPPRGAPPQVVPTNSGGIQLEWHEQGVDLEIEIFPAGEPVVYCSDRAAGTDWEAPLSDCSAELKSLLQRLDEVWATSNR